MHTPATTKSVFGKNIQPGEMYAVQFGWRGSQKGHIITAAVGDNGKVRLYDPQNNEITENEKISQYFRNTVELSIINLTNIRLDEKFCDNIIKKEKDKNETRGKKYI